MTDTVHTVVGLGELLWDLFPTPAGAPAADGGRGGVDRRLGGAPANVAHHATVLGDRGVLATRVGHDEAGDLALAELGARGVDLRAVQRDPVRATGTAEVSFAASGAPRFTFSADAAWTAPRWCSEWEALFSGADVICFGSMLCAFEAGRAAVERAAAAAPAHALRLLDLNLRPPLTTDAAVDAALACANVLKLSEEEAALLGRRLGVPDAATALLRRRPELRAVAITRGARGSLLCTADGGRDEHGGFSLDEPVDPRADPVGAGDAFTAALAHHLVRGHAPSRANRAANRYAAFVASRAGAMPAVPAPVRAEVVA